MLFSEKLVYLRKKSGLTQEALAEALGVSRQSISKWEGAGAMPEMAKIIEISKYFHVSTDFLLLDSMTTADEVTDLPAEDTLSSVTLEDADAYMNHLVARAPRVARATSLFILSALPVVLSGIKDTDGAYALGTIGTLIVVATGVFLLVGGAKMPEDFQRFDDPIDTAYGVDGAMKKRRNDYAPLHRRNLAAGIVLCILSAAPLLISSATNDDGTIALGLAATLCIVAAGVYLIVRTAVIEEGFEKILEQGGFTRRKKIARRRYAPAPRAYYLLILMIYLGTSFYTGKWQYTWIIWPAALFIKFIAASLAESRDLSREE